MPSKCRKCRFRDPTFKMGFQTNIFCSKVPSKCRKCRYRDPNFKKVSGDMLPDPLQLCRYYGLPLTKILATPLTTVYAVFYARDSPCKVSSPDTAQMALTALGLVACVVVPPLLLPTPF